jgi:cyclopropane fatty-acyl-phospholipid synthase-like methyltransferase
MRNDPDHYVETCRRWRKQLRARRAEAAQFVDAEVIDNFLKYLALSALSFQMRKTGLLRITLRRTDRPLGLSA